MKILNQAASIQDPAGVYPQSWPDSVDFDIISAADALTGVVSGCAVTSNANMNPSVAAGTIAVLGVSAAVTGGTVTVTAADATNPRFDLVVSNNAGTLSVIAGTPAAVPIYPTIPANSVVLACIYVAHAASQITTAAIVDKRIIIIIPAAAGGLVKNYVNNGSFAVNQVVTPTTTDNSYPIDGWRLLLGAANAATFVQDTADVPTGAGFAAKLIVGAGNNNKFGLLCPIENLDMLDTRGQAISLRVPLKATANLSNSRIAVLQFTGTADAISADPVSAWNATGTNPTLNANWSFVGTPVNLGVTTAWADYTAINGTVSGSATNLAILVWNDATTTTQTTDILRIGGYVTLGLGATAPAAQVAKFDDEWRKCRYYYRSTFPRGVAPATNAGVTGALEMYWGAAGSSAMLYNWLFPDKMRTTPTVNTFNPSAANTSWRDVTASSDLAATITNASECGVSISSANLGSGDHMIIHATADARL